MVRWLWRWRLTAVVAVVMLAVVITGVTLALTTAAPPAAPPTSGASADLPADGRTSATLVVASGAPDLSVRVADLGSTLVRASVPAGAPVRPVFSIRNGAVRLTLVTVGGTEVRYPIGVLLNSAVTWTLGFDGGTQRTVADLRGGKIGDVTFAAGSDVIDLTMPAPRGTSVIQVASGASQFQLRLPPGVPARVTASAGAALLTVDSVNRTGVAGGTVVTPPGWSSAAGRFDVDATSGIGQMSVTRYR
jgi:hypothetical protein